MPPVMRCKMTCHEVTHVRHANQERDDPLCDVRFGAVCALPKDPPGENAIYGKYTPVAEYKAKIVKSVAASLSRAKPITSTSRWPNKSARSQIEPGHCAGFSFPEIAHGQFQHRGMRRRA